MKKRLYQLFVQIYWRLPFPEKTKERFLRLVRQIWPRRNTVISAPDDLHQEMLKQYVKQILETPEKSNEYVELASNIYMRAPGDPMILAYYLPQYYPTLENDEWWGRGTTEWHNVSRAVPQFVGHYQPRLPAELGYYDLRITENIARQIELAKMHGIYGFAFYFYWFDGKRLLDRPLDAFITDPHLDFPFCLCWANESWTRRFDGTCGEELIHQNEARESYQSFIKCIKSYVTDKRYMLIDGRPLLIIYRPSFIPECQEVLAYWRSYCREEGFGNPYLIGVKENTFDGDLLALGFDAQSEFHPGTVFRYCKNITNEINYLRSDFSGLVLDYVDLVENKKYFNFQARKLYRAVMPMWDNTPRRNNSGMIFHRSSPNLYKKWLKDVLYETRKNCELDAPLVFINAWNEWGESAYLEPDYKYGYAYLRATREALEESRNGGPPG
jgi:lipopolysaccharide biosynthesis protein